MTRLSGHERPACFPLPLQFEPLVLRRYYKRVRLLSPFVQVTNGKEYVCEAGSVIDGASVPWPFDPFDFWGWAAVPHDDAYRTGKIPRKEADQNFLAGMLASKPSVEGHAVKRALLGAYHFVKCWGGYFAVRAFGWKHYNYREEQEKMNLRIEAVAASAKLLGVIGLVFAACAVACLAGCSATTKAGGTLPLNLGVTEAGVTVGFTGPLTGNEYQAAVPVNLDKLPLTIKRPAAAPQLEK